MLAAPFPGTQGKTARANVVPGTRYRHPRSTCGRRGRKHQQICVIVSPTADTHPRADLGHVPMARDGVTILKNAPGYTVTWMCAAVLPRPEGDSMTSSGIPRIMIDGVLCDPAVPPRPVLDDGLVRGDGVFEGLRAYGRRPRTPAEHLDRLATSAAGIDLPMDRDLIARELDELCAAASAPDCAVRIMLTRGGQRIVREESLPALPDSWLLSAQAHRISPLLIGSKTLSYAANMQANRRARAAGANEALLYDADDNGILEGPTSSFLWLEGDALCAPPLSTGILDSITRRLMAEITDLHVRARTLDDLQDASGAMLVSTVMELQPVHGVVGVVEWPGVPTRLADLRTALAEASANRAVRASA